MKKDGRLMRIMPNPCLEGGRYVRLIVLVILT
jgi:hypothetical protein